MHGSSLHRHFPDIIHPLQGAGLPCSCMEEVRDRLSLVQCQDRQLIPAQELPLPIWVCSWMNSDLGTPARLQECAAPSSENQVLEPLLKARGGGTGCGSQVLRPALLPLHSETQLQTSAMPHHQDKAHFFPSPRLKLEQRESLLTSLFSESAL